MEQIHRVAAVLSELGPAVLVSGDGVGLVYAGRAQTPQPPGPSGPFWFLADARRVSRWNPAGQPVTLTHHAPGSPFYLALHGTATPLPDAAARTAAWDSRFTPWFPQGPSDPRLALLEVQVGDAECIEWRNQLAG